MCSESTPVRKEKASLIKSLSHSISLSKMGVNYFSLRNPLCAGPIEVILQSKKGGIRRKETSRLLRASYVYAGNYLEPSRPFHIVHHFILIWTCEVRVSAPILQMRKWRLTGVSKFTWIETERSGIWILLSTLQPHSTVSLLTLLKSKSLRGSNCPALQGPYTTLAHRRTEPVISK